MLIVVFILSRKTVRFTHSKKKVESLITYQRYPFPRGGFPRLSGTT